MIGFYVHHVGRGHLTRAGLLARRLVAEGRAVTGLGSLPRPAGWPGEWVELARDDATTTPPVDPTARGRLHWVPRGDEGLRDRSAAIAAWLARARPDAVVVDVSVEVALLVRLHGVPVVGVVLPGSRGDDAHRLGLDVADRLVSFWPPEATGMLRDVPAATLARLEPVGGLARFPVGSPRPRPAGTRGGRAVLLLGAGGHDVSPDRVETMLADTPDWSWTVLDGRPGAWVDDPSALLADADVVVAHTGQNAVAEIAAARRPAVLLPQDRPHDEQRTTGTVLDSGAWPATVCQRWPDDGWPERLERTARLDGAAWATWCDGRTPERFAAVVGSLVGDGR